MRANLGLLRIGVVAGLAILMAVSMLGIADAHTGEQSYVYLDIYDSSIEGEIHYPVSDLNDVLGTSIPDDPDDAAEWADANAEVIYAYSAEHIAMADLDGEEWPISFGGFTSIDFGDGAYLNVEIIVDRDFVDVPRRFIVAYDAIIHAKPQRDALLVIATDFGSGTFNNEADSLVRYTADTTEQVVDLGNTSLWSGFSGVIALGTEHIRIGTDHILFILALVLPSVLIFSPMQGWQPSASFGSSLWRVLKIVTMFTIAHTITLTLGGLGIVVLPAALVETTIAISIILAALHNLRPRFVNKEWVIAFVFGLVHGFGFAGLLSDLGLTQSRQLISLLGFNIGIEIGQAIVILLVFPALFLARRTRVFLPVMKVSSVVLIVIATVWAFERAFGIDLGSEWFAIRISVWPRQLVPVVFAYAFAGFFYWYDRDHDQLLPMQAESPHRQSVAKSPN